MDLNMEALGGLLAVMGAVVFPLVFIVGMIKPSLFKKTDKKPASRKQIAIFSVIASITCLLVGAMLLPDSDEPLSKTAADTPVVAVPIETTAAPVDNAPINNTPVEVATIEPAPEAVADTEMSYMAVTPQQIRDHMTKIDNEVLRISHFEFDNIGENAKQSRRMLALRDASMPFGETIFDEPYGYCGAAETFAVSYWYSMLGGDKNKTADDELKQYNDYKKACLEAVTAVESGEYQP